MQTRWNPLALRLRSVLAFSLLFVAHVAFGQAIWSGSALVTASLSLSGSGNVLSTTTKTINNNTQQFQYYNSGVSSYWYEFNLTDGDASNYSSSTGNLRFYLNSQNGSWTTLPSGTIVFSFLFPTTTTGTVTGFSLLSDSRNIAPSFTVTNNGAGLITFTQTADINFGGSGPASNLIGTFSTTVIPEPSTYAALAGAAALGLVALRRRRR